MRSFSAARFSLASWANLRGIKDFPNRLPDDPERPVRRRGVAAQCGNAAARAREPLLPSPALPPGRYGALLERGRGAVEDEDRADAVEEELADASEEAQEMRVADEIPPLVPEKDAERAEMLARMLDVGSDEQRRASHAACCEDARCACWRRGVR